MPDAGHVTAATRDELAGQLRGWSAFALAPRLDEALAWFDAAAAGWKERTERGEPAPFAVECTWAEGRVIPARSRIFRSAS